ncbi:MAG: tetratricopeptide repeat-containing sensor histidine kinase [Rhizobacter sp.]|nr:tetratricopeptide repeat-containing sensor histidine kinase [Chlorobiales bacterium]
MMSVSQAISDLEARLNATTDTQDQGEERISILNELSRQLRFIDATRALDLARDAYQLSQALGNPKGFANSLLNIGVVHWVLSNYEQSLNALGEAAALYVGQGNELGEADAISVVGMVHDTLGDFDKALPLFTRALRIRERLGDKQGEASSANSIGILHAKSGNHLQSRVYYERSLQLYTEIQSQRGMATQHNNLGLSYKNMGEPEKALELYAKGIEVLRDMGDKYTTGFFLVNSGDAYLMLGNDQEALARYQEALQLLDETGEKASHIDALVGVGRVMQKRLQWDAALAAFYKALMVAEALKSRPHLQLAHEEMAKTYKAEGNFEKALSHFEKFVAVREELSGEEIKKKTVSLMIEFQAERSAKEAELYKLRNTELAEANRKLAEASKLKSELLSMAAHDLKSPLQTIMGFAQLTLELETDGEVKQYQQHIRMASGRMLHLISDLLESAAMESENLTLQKTAFDLSELARHVIESLSPQASLKSQQIDFIASGAEPCTISADRQRIAEALENLISNAIKYSPHDKTIWVKVEKGMKDAIEPAEMNFGGGMKKEMEEKGEKKGKQFPDSSFISASSSFIRISVSDEGLGMGEEDLKHVFKPFQRLSARPTGNESSTGLGLSIVKRLVDLHGGGVRAYSAGKGFGSIFTIELPC